MHLGFQCITQAKSWLEGDINVLLSSTWVTGSVLHPSQRISPTAPESPRISVCLLKRRTHSTLPQPKLQPCLSWPRSRKYARGWWLVFQNPKGERPNTLRPTLPHSLSPPRLTMWDRTPSGEERSPREWEEGRDRECLVSPFPLFESQRSDFSLAHPSLQWGTRFYLKATYWAVHSLTALFLFQS